MPKYRVNVYYSGVTTVVVDTNTEERATEVAERYAPIAKDLDLVDTDAQIVSDQDAARYINYDTNGIIPDDLQKKILNTKEGETLTNNEFTYTKYKGKLISHPRPDYPYSPILHYTECTHRFEGTPANGVWILKTGEYFNTLEEAKEWIDERNQQ